MSQEKRIIQTWAAVNCFNWGQGCRRGGVAAHQSEFNWLYSPAATRAPCSWTVLRLRISTKGSVCHSAWVEHSHTRYSSVVKEIVGRGRGWWRVRLWPPPRDWLRPPARACACAARLQLRNESATERDDLSFLLIHSFGENCHFIDARCLDQWAAAWRCGPMLSYAS